MAEDHRPVPAAATTAATGVDQPAAAGTAKGPGAVHGFFQWIRDYKAGIAAHPVRSAIYTAIVAVAAFGLSEGWELVKAKYWGDGKYITQIREEQKKGFSDLESKLDALNRTVDESTRDALIRDVRQAAQRIDASQVRLVDQLELGKHETERLSAALVKARGIPGGYDFILGESNGFPLSSATSLGVSDFFYDKEVKVNLSNAGGEDITDRSLASGQSLPFTNDRGQACKVAVVSIENKTASFKVTCSGGDAVARA